MATFYGQIMKINEAQTFPSKLRGRSEPFRKRTIIVRDTVESQFINEVEFTAVGERVKLIDGWREGDEVSIEYFLNGRKYIDKQGHERHFIEARIGSISRHGEVRELISTKEENKKINLDDGWDDDIPF